MTSPPPGATLVQRARYLATASPDRPAYTFVDYQASRHGLAQTLTWAEVDRRAAAVAAVLRGRGMAGERAAVLAPQGLGYVTAMLGAFYARVVAIPLFTPDLPRYADRLTGVLADAEPACVLTTEAALPGVTSLLAARAREHPAPRLVLAVDSVDPGLAAGWRDEEVTAADVAYLQYTSGSTRQPAGVVITHGCLTANAAQISAGLGAEPYDGTTTVGWLPLFHDMGFVLTAAMPMAVGAQAVFMDPAAFLIRPVRWLQLASGRRRVFTAGPNFAYDYCVAHVGAEARAGLDLSGVRAFLNGSEPVQPATMRRFAAAFAACGLPARALTPAYGLAEATVYVSSGSPDAVSRVTAFDRHAIGQGSAVERPEDDPGSIALASCGRPAGQHVAIVDPETRTPRPAGQVGEIWVHGPNVSPGYFRPPRGSREVFGAGLRDGAGGLPAGCWLRTGDTGMMHDGELFVTGRLKDLIIIDGTNHYPQDVEATAQDAHPAIRPDRVAALGAPGAGGTRLVVIAERGRRSGGETDLGEVTRAVRAAVSARHGVGVDDFRLIQPGAIPRTSSGKIARAACLDRYLAGELAGDRE